MPGPRIRAAIERADDDASDLRLTGPDDRPRAKKLVMGDPQAPFEKVLAVLDGHGLLGLDGRLRPEVALVSIGDHFDYGGSPVPLVADIERSGRRLLAWLSAHPTDQVTLILGNHDLGRVGELVRFDDEGFARARAEALEVKGDPERERAFRGCYPELPTSEVARRDFSGFSAAQQKLVARLLRAGRFLVASAHDARTLLCHAGISRDDESGARDALALAAALNERLSQAVASWDQADPLVLPGLHQPGSAELGEGGGIFYHRPCHPDRVPDAQLSGPLRRRYDARRLPPGLLQVIGHVRDGKCRELLGEWVEGPPGRPGELRCLVTDGRAVRYGAGIPRNLETAHAQMIFTDGAMSTTAASAYQLLDLCTLQASVETTAISVLEEAGS